MAVPCLHLSWNRAFCIGRSCRRVHQSSSLFNSDPPRQFVQRNLRNASFEVSGLRSGRRSLEANYRPFTRAHKWLLFSWRSVIVSSNKSASLLSPGGVFLASQTVVRSVNMVICRSHAAQDGSCHQSSEFGARSIAGKQLKETNSVPSWKKKKN